MENGHFHMEQPCRHMKRKQVMLQIEQACTLGMKNNILSNVTFDIRIQKNFKLQIIDTPTTNLDSFLI
jgi:hypothetical protein